MNAFDIILGVLALTGYVIAGVFAFRGQWDAATREKREETDKLSDGLITRLQQTVDQAEKTIAALSTKLDQTTKELHLMQGRNSVLEGLFNGSENSIMAFLKQAPALMAVANDSNAVGKETQEAITRLTETFAKFIDNLQPILIHIETNTKAQAEV